MPMINSLTLWFQQFRWIDALISLGIFLLFLIFRRLFIRYLYAYLLRRFNNFNGIVTTLEAFNKPLRLLFVLLGAYIAIRYFVGDTWTNHHWTLPFLRSFAIILVGWALYNLTASSSFLLARVGKHFGQDSTSMLIPFLSRLLRIVVVLFAAAALLSEWGFNVNGIVAGMGLGSLAVALAAQNTLSNIFGGVVLILEKPFVRGDWIQSPETQGIVEDITFRSTKIRTFDDSLVIIPNSKIADQSITNWSQMGHRRINFTLAVASDADPVRLRRAIKRMQQEVENNEGVEEDTVQVKFNSFSKDSLGILFNCFARTTVWGEYLVTLQEVNLMILQVLKDEEIALAFPARRIRVSSEDGQASFFDGSLQPESQADKTNLSKPRGINPAEPAAPPTPSVNLYKQRD
ncbi:mechanosensitive ion channel family protein [Saccharibacillus kuerlensis]|uniref:MscS family protein YhdY n=1 Tax=Saccharibacillus kuerlensis TaxID=459527 RepID=A0ABQ2L8H6_9BACL|nr:mechanosensitive ion channel family protein [Saccharibacillus kuerlensis]GGO06806.1 putative MscS family protein YhdY [Saccharibacillus kuerlensis]